MKLNRNTLLAFATQAALYTAFSGGAQANTLEDRLQAMERRMMELEGRLVRSEEENQRLRRQVSKSASPAEGSTTAKSAAEADVGLLNAKVATLEKKMELDRKTAAEAAKNTPKVEMGANGLSVKSADEAYRVSLRGYAQGDGNFFMDDSGDAVSDNFSIRRARLTLDGTAFKWVDFRFAPDFGAGNLRLFDAYVDLHYFPFASLMAGKFRPPINGLERQQSATAISMVERGLTQNLTPARDLGVMLHGEFPYPGYKVQYSMPPVFKEFVGYQLGVFNGARDSGNVDSEKDDNKEFAGRLFSHPFLRSGFKPLQGLGLGIAGSWGQPHENAINGLKTTGQQTFLTYKSGVTSSGEAYRITPGAYYYYGPFGALTEYVLSTQHLAAGSRRVRQDNTAWQIVASYVLTGEDNSFQGVRPANAFDPFAGTWGAFQIAARWSELDVDDDTFKFKGVFSDPAKSASKATEWAVAMNWYLNHNIRFMADYAQTYFDGGASGGNDRPTEKVFQTRFQYQF